MVYFPRHLPMSRTPVKTGWWRASGQATQRHFATARNGFGCLNRGLIVGQTTSQKCIIQKSSHTPSAALSRGDGSCAARHPSRRPVIALRGSLSTVESFAGRNQGDPMSESVDVQYVGFEAKALARVYSFVVRRALNQTSEFTLSIGNEAFGSRRVRFQDAPEICSLRLHHELAAFGNHPPVAHYHISETDLDDYRSSHAPKVSGYPYKPKPPQDV
jgi:hypothetical protein